MSNEVQFDFEKEERPEYNRSGSKLSRLVVKWSGGLVKDEMQANYVILLFIVCSTIFSITLVLSATNTKTPVAVQYREDISAEVRMKLPPGVFETIPSKFK